MQNRRRGLCMQNVSRPTTNLETSPRATIFEADLAIIGRIVRQICDRPHKTSITDKILQAWLSLRIHRPFYSYPLLVRKTPHRHEALQVKRINCNVISFVLDDLLLISRKRNKKKIMTAGWIIYMYMYIYI